MSRTLIADMKTPGERQKAWREYRRLMVQVSRFFFNRDEDKLAVMTATVESYFGPKAAMMFKLSNGHVMPGGAA